MKEGYEYMDYDLFLEQYNRRDTFSIRQGIRLTKLSYGYAEAKLDSCDKHMNLHNCAHGGILFTLSDIAAGCCLSTKGQHCVTLSATINYIRPGFCGTLLAKAKSVKMGRQIGISDVSVYDEDGNLVCTGTYTMMYKDRIAWLNSQEPSEV